MVVVAIGIHSASDPGASDRPYYDLLGVPKVCFWGTPSIESDPALLTPALLSHVS